MERTPRSGKVGFIGHPQDLDMFRAYIHHLRPDKVYRDGLILKLFEWTPSYKVTGWEGLSFDGRRSLDAIMVMVPFLPEMRALKLKRIVEKIEQALAICAEEGCTVAALGAFTSIILQGQEADLAARYGLRITSGNSLTALLIIESVEELARRFGIELASTTVAIIGASGDVGSACFAHFAGQAGEIHATARGLVPLEELVQKLQPITTAEVRVTADNREALRAARIAIFVTSAHDHVASLAEFDPGTVVCDASAPLNVRTDGSLRPDVFVYHGGVARLPFPLDLGFDIGLASPMTFYGCQVEGLAIGADPTLPDSWGRGNITPEKIQRYRDWLGRVGNVAVAYSHGRHSYSEQEIDEYAARLTWGAAAR